MPPKEPTNPYLEHLENARAWVQPGAIAKVLGVSRSTAYPQLRELAEAKKVQCRGASRSLRYAALGVPSEDQTAPAPAKPERKTSEPKPKTKAKRKVAAKPHRNLAEFGATPGEAPTRQLPATVPPAGDRISWAITDQGHVAINDGKSTIQLKPGDIAHGVAFLERTQLLWMVARP